MAAAMLVLLAAAKVPTLRDLLDREVLRAGRHLTMLFSTWYEIAGTEVCPSIDQSYRIIQEADRYINNLFDER